MLTHLRQELFNTGNHQGAVGEALEMVEARKGEESSVGNATRAVLGAFKTWFGISSVDQARHR